jgi:hypothetical protein
MPVRLATKPNLQERSFKMFPQGTTALADGKCI